MRTMTGKGAYGHIKVNYYTFNKKPATVRRQLTQQVWYTAYGTRENNPEQRLRGGIYDQDGEAIRYGDYKAWAIGTSRRRPLIYRAIVSPKYHILPDHDFVKMVKAANKAHGFDTHFRLVIHTDAPNKHAHVLFGATERMNKKQLEAWKITLREQMLAYEQIRCQEQGRPLPRANETEADYRLRMAQRVSHQQEIEQEQKDAMRRAMWERRRQQHPSRRQRRRNRYVTKEREDERDCDDDLDLGL